MTVRNSTAAEALANADGSDHGVFIRELARDFDVKVDTTNFYTDNESSIKLHRDFYACKKSKPIVLRERVMTCVYRMHHIRGSRNYADFLTKPLSRDVFVRFRTDVMNATVNFSSTVIPAAFWLLNELYAFVAP